MSRARQAAFVGLALAGLPAGLATAAVQVAALMPSIPVPVLGPLLAAQDEATLLVLLGAAVAAALLLLLLGWGVSLDPDRPRRPFAWLYVLALGPSLVPAVGLWLTLELQGVLRRGEALGGATAAWLLLPLLLPAAEIGLGALFAALAGAAQRAGWLGVASWLTRQYQRLRPDHPELTRRIGLLDYERGQIDLAEPRLAFLLDAGRADLPVLDALWDMARRRQDRDRLLQLGAELLARTGSRHDPTRVHRVLGDIYAARADARAAIPHLEVSIDRDNPSDLAELGRLYVADERWDDVAALLARLEGLEGPPRQRCTALYREVLRRKDPDLLPLVRQFADFLDRFRMEEERTRVLEIILELDPDDSGARDRLVAYYRAEGMDFKLVEHLLVRRERAAAPDDDLDAELIELLGRLRRLDEAAALAAACVERSPDSFRFLFLLANTAFAREALDEADRVAARAEEVAADAERERIRPLRRKIQSALDERELRTLEERVRAQPLGLEVGLDFVRRLIRKGRLERATVEVDALMERLPAARVEVKRELRALVGEDGKPYLIAEFLSELHLDDREFDAVHALYAAMARSSFSTQQVLREGAERILGRDPDHAPSHLRLFEVALAAGDQASACAHARRYLELGGPLTFEQRVALFDAYCVLEDLEHGEPIGLALLEEQPYAIDRITRLAALYIANRKFGAALEWLARAKRVEPGNSAIYHLIEVARTRQREQRSLELREAIDKAPDDAALLEELADLMVEFKRTEDALRYYQRAAQAAQDEGRRLVCTTRLAWCMARRHMFDTALETLAEVPLRLNEDRQTLSERKRAVYEIAELLEDHNHFEQAVALYKQVFKVDAGFRHVMEKVSRLAR